MVITIIAILAGVLLPATIRAYQWAKNLAIGCYAHKENQINTFLDDNASEKHMIFWTTNKVKPWSDQVYATQ
jgi:hypothetical protein